MLLRTRRIFGAELLRGISGRSKKRAVFFKVGKTEHRHPGLAFP